MPTTASPAPDPAPAAPAAAQACTAQAPTKRPASPPPHHSPTPVATLSHLPTTLLPTIAYETATAPARLSTLVITSHTPPLYAAIVEYAALSSPSPPSASAASPAAAAGPHSEPSSLPLRVDSFLPPDPASDSDSASEAELMHFRGRRTSRACRFDIGANLIPRRRTRKRVPVPRFTLAFGRSVVVWPPPPHLTPEALIEQRERERELARKRHRASGKTSLWQRGRKSSEDAPNGDDHPNHQDAQIGREPTEPASNGSADPLPHAKPNTEAAAPAEDGDHRRKRRRTEPTANASNNEEKPAGDNAEAEDNSKEPHGESSATPDQHDSDKLTHTPEPSAKPESTRPRQQKSLHVVHYSVGDPVATRHGGISTFRELLLVSPDGPDVLRTFCTEILQWRADRDHEEYEHADKFVLQRFKTGMGGGVWNCEGLKRARPASSVILPDDQMSTILDDVRSFLKPETKKWYISHGLPQRRSYLFYGVPGSGKTSTIRVIASTFRLNCCYLSMTNPDFNNQMLGDALADLPGNALIVLEDVDALFNEDRKNAQGGALTFSGLLNALDGLISAEGVITIMTTNHFERLDKALVRGGRVDRRFHFGKPTPEQIKDLFKSFYPNAGKELCARFLEAIVARREGDEARSIATLQELFIKQREKSGEECVAAIPSFYKDHFPTGTAGKDENLYI